MNLQGGFEPKTSGFSTKLHTVLPRQAEGKVQNPFSSVEKPPAIPPGTGAVGEGRRAHCCRQAGRRQGLLQKEQGVDLRKLRGKLGKLRSWQGMWSWEEGGAGGFACSWQGA